MLAWLRNWWQTTQRAPWQERAYLGALLATLLFGVFLRLNSILGYQISFWYDEALWGSRLLKQPLLSLEIRPVGFMWAARGLVRTFGATEFWYRFLPNLGALLSLLLMPWVASRLLEAKPLRLLLVLLFAIHPALVDFANEFKPYSFEVLVHLIPIALYLRYQQTERRGYLYALLAYLPVSFLLAYNMAFAFPALLLLCLWHALRSKQRARLLAATLLSGALCAGAAAAIYTLALKDVTSEERTESYWGRKYDVFYTTKHEESRVDWTLTKYEDMAALIGYRRELWATYGRMPERSAKELGAAERLFWVGLNFAGLYYLWRRQRPLLLLFGLPILGLILANALGKWPFGAFRTNVFLVVYLFPVPLLGMQLLGGLRLLWARGLAVAVAALTLLPGFLFGFDLHGHKRTFTRDHYQREVIAKLYAYRQAQLAEDPNREPARLVMDAHTYHSHNYYLNDHPVFSPKYKKFFQANFAQDNAGGPSMVGKVQQRLKRSEEGVWVVASKPTVADSLLSYAEKSTVIAIKEDVAGQHLIMLLKRK